MKATLFFIILITFHSLAFSQQNLDFFDFKLSKQDRKSLKKSIKRLNQLIREGNWAEVYSLFPIGYEEIESKAEFIQGKQEDSKKPRLTRRTISFKPKDFFALSNKRLNERVHIAGCVTVIENGIIRKYYGSLESRRTGSEQWFFAYLPYINPDSSAGGPKPC